MTRMTTLRPLGKERAPGEHQGSRRARRALSGRARATGSVFLAAALMMAACDDEKKATSAQSAEPSPVEEPAEPAPPVPQGPPEFAVDDVSPRVGFSRAVVAKPDGNPNPEGLAQLRQKLEAAKSHIHQKQVTVRVHRQAKPAWVTTYLNEIGKLEPSEVIVETETRPEFPAQLKTLPETRLSNPPACSLIGMILADRGTAIWRLNGGTARKRGRGMGGPDLTMTGETIVSMAKGCADSSYFFATGAEGVEWGLLYDLAASALSLEKAGLTVAVFPSQPAVAGHAVELLK